MKWLAGLLLAISVAGCDDDSCRLQCAFDCANSPTHDCEDNCVDDCEDEKEKKKVKHTNLLAILCGGMLAACSTPQLIEPAHDDVAHAPSDVPIKPAQQGDFWNDPWGYCEEFVVDTCHPSSVDARSMCAQRYGSLYGSAFECWHSDEPALSYGCVPLLWGREQCTVPIVCPGAEFSPSVAWCCPFGDPPPPPPPPTP